MKKIVFTFLLIISVSAFSQEKEEIAAFFDQYLTTKSQLEMIEKSIPTLEECKLVFKGDDAKVYHDAIQSVKTEIEKMKKTIPNETFVKSTYEEFNSNDAIAGDKNSTYGMHRISKRLKPDIQYYMVSYLDQNGSQSRLSPYKFFVYLNGKWRFFPKPTIVFKD